MVDHDMHRVRQRLNQQDMSIRKHNKEGGGGSV